MSKIVNQIAVLSIHIPKTGGSSFQNTLVDAYGQSAFLRLDFTVQKRLGIPRIVATNRTSQASIDEIIEQGKLNDQIKIVHGHFHYSDFIQFFELSTEAKVITWLRDPIDRIVSNYNYLVSILDQDLDHTPRSREVLNRMLKSLPEFSRIPRDIALYSDYLSGQDLADYDFIGIVEDYDNELKRLGKILGARELPTHHVNKTARKLIRPTATEEQEITKLHEQNQRIYQRAKVLKDG